MIVNLEKKEPKKQQIHFEVEPEVHTLIKASASLKGISLKLWMLRAAMEQIRKEKLLL